MNHIKRAELPVLPVFTPVFRFKRELLRYLGDSHSDTFPPIDNYQTIHPNKRRTGWAVTQSEQGNMFAECISFKNTWHYRLSGRIPPKVPSRRLPAGRIGVGSLRTLARLVALNAW